MLTLSSIVRTGEGRGKADRQTGRGIAGEAQFPSFSQRRGIPSSHHGEVCMKMKEASVQKAWRSRQWALQAQLEATPEQIRILRAQQGSQNEARTPRGFSAVGTTGSDICPAVVSALFNSLPHPFEWQGRWEARSVMWDPPMLPPLFNKNN